jgi:hypothetical protein
MKKVVQDLVLPGTAKRARTAIAREKPERNASSEAAATSAPENGAPRNTRNRTACTGRLGKPGPETLETQEILEQTKNYC